MKKGLEKCFEALERIKKNKPNVIQFVDLPRNKVTPAIISKEAGFDSGYLKRKRPQHHEIISLIESYKYSDTGGTLTNREQLEREKRKSKRLQELLKETEGKLYNALARELLLLDQIDHMEQELLKTKRKYNG